MTSLDSQRWRVLVADDQPDVREALRLLLKGEGFDTDAVPSPATLLTSLDTREYDAVLMDLNYARDTTSGQEGLDLLSEIRTRDGSLPVIVMTAWGSLNLAVEAMRRGAKDFIQKPWKTLACWPFCALKSSSRMPFAIASASRLRIACCARMAGPC